MARSNNSFIKKQKADRKAKKKKEKLATRLEKKEQPTSGKLEDMIAYVDEFGNFSDTPPEPKDEKKDAKDKDKDKDKKAPRDSKGKDF